MSSLTPICDHPLRGGGRCARDAGHKGKHTSVVFVCEGCSRTCPGQPYRRQEIWVCGELDDVFNFCFLCVKEGERADERLRREHPEYQ